MRSAFSIFALLGIVSSAHATVDIESAIAKVRTSCGDLSSELKQMKTLAGVGTGVSAAGALAGGAAVATGVMKSNTEKDIDALDDLTWQAWQDIVAQNQNNCQENEGVKVCSINPDTVTAILKKYGLDSAADEGAFDAAKEKKMGELDKKSETLGNIRTGTLAATTAANIAGAAVGGVNMKKAKGTLTEMVSDCLASVKELSAAYGQARIARTASDEDLGRVETIVRVCNEWSTVDLSKIDNRATGSFASSVVGATTGAAGTITSALANSENIRTANDQKEKNLNLASNVLAGGATVASTAATIFNATQISAIKRASTVADACDGALRN